MYIDVSDITEDLVSSGLAGAAAGQGTAAAAVRPGASGCLLVRGIRAMRGTGDILLIVCADCIMWCTNIEREGHADLIPFGSRILGGG
jgi:hypothetical protein